MPAINKSREELPWLYYPRSNSVRVINSHLDGGGGGGGSIAVNGKSPIAAWIPSLDTSGNGTTTLNDLSGNGFNGTLTNMDATSDWVADTDAGGVRALDFDGTNDYVAVGSPSGLVGIAASYRYAVSLWFKCSAQTTGVAVAIGTGATNQVYIFPNDSATNGIRVRVSGSNIMTAHNADLSGSWYHIVLCVAANNDYKVFLDGSQVDSYSSATSVSSADAIYIGSSNGAGNFWNGRLDDIRIFDQPLDGTDIGYLFNSGNGRGRTS